MKHPPAPSSHTDPVIDSAAPRTPDHEVRLARSEFFLPLLAIGIVLLFVAVTALLMQAFPEHGTLLSTATLLAVLLGAYLVVISITRMRSHLLAPLSNLRDWAQHMRQGDLSAKVPVPGHGEFRELARDINDLGEALRVLTRNMDEQVRQQTQRLERKTRSLKILYDVAASSNSARDIDELLTRFLHTLTEIMYAHAGTVRLLAGDDQMRLVASIGFDDNVLEQNRLVPLERCMCALNSTHNVIVCQNSYRECGNLVGPLALPERMLDRIAIPLRYKGQALGIYNLFVEKLGISERADIQDILTNIGQHLSLAIEKTRMDEEMKRYSIMQERSMLANELHDSLAQTLASLRFQVRNIQQTLQQSASHSADDELTQLRAGIDEANNELRELLAHFRVPMDKRGLIPAIETVVARFRKESGIALFFQNECAQLRLPPMLEVHVLHIIQESLANIRKHSQATHVRLLIRHDSHGVYHILVEDDGIGISDTTWDGSPGEHVGLTIMQERAKRIGGELTIESEPAEGTRVELTFCTGTTDVGNSSDHDWNSLSAIPIHPE